MRAAIELSDMSCPVTLIEREYSVGGRVAQWDLMFTTNQKCNEGNLKKAIDACQVEVPDEFNFNITSRKAIYHNFPSESPQFPVIDIKNCTRYGECTKICPNIDFSQKEEIVEINVGSVLIATGFDPYAPKEEEFVYHMFANIIILPHFKRIIELNDINLVFRGKEIKNIAYINCVGSRQVEGGKNEGKNKHCSRYCCTSVIHAAIQAKKKFDHINNYHFIRGIRTYWILQPGES